MSLRYRFAGVVVAFATVLATPVSSSAEELSFRGEPIQTADPRPIIVEPATGSVLVQGRVRVRAVLPRPADSSRVALVEVSWLPPPALATTMLLLPAMTVRYCVVPLASLEQGAVLPREMTSGWVGPARIRVRAEGPDVGAWSDDVDFSLGSAAQRHATAVGAWRAGVAQPRSTWRDAFAE